MSIVKFFFSRAHRTSKPERDERKHGEQDPLAHPDLAGMSMTELADLPLAPENFGRPEAVRSDGGAARCG